MTVNGISGANNGMQAGSSGRITQMDSVSKNIQNQIANAQKSCRNYLLMRNFLLKIR